MGDSTGAAGLERATPSLGEPLVAPAQILVVRDVVHRRGQEHSDRVVETPSIRPPPVEALADNEIVVPRRLERLVPFAHDVDPITEIAEHGDHPPAPAQVLMAQEGMIALGKQEGLRKVYEQCGSVAVPGIGAVGVVDRRMDGERPPCRRTETGAE